MTNLEFQMRARTMQTLSFYSQRGQNFGVKEAFYDHWPFQMHIRLYHDILQHLYAK